MSQFFSLVRAAFSQDMNIFAYKSKRTSIASKIALPVLLGGAVMLSIGCTLFPIFESLSAAGLTFVILPLLVAMLTIITIFEGIYKSQDILFNCKDNDLLFSLPIPRRRILAIRVLKLIVFQLIFNLIFMLPVLALYVYFEQPGLSFYVVSFAMIFLIPLIPTAISVVIGYLIKTVSFRFRFRKAAQIILSFLAIFALMVVIYGMEGLAFVLVQNAVSINETISTIYYPAGLYAELAFNFDFLKFCILVLFNITPLLLVVWLCSRNYFKVISKTKGSTLVESTASLKALQTGSPLSALVKKELRRYFSSTVYIFNTLFGPLLMAFATIAICTSTPSIIQSFTETNAELSASEITKFLPIIFTMLIIFTGAMTSITSSSISIEGKSLNITKSLPVSTKTIFLAKILMSLIITMPVILICDLAFLICFPVNIGYLILFLAFSVLVPLFSALVGLLINLRYPKLNASSDAEVIKQSTSSMLCSFIGIGTVLLSGIMIPIFADFPLLGLSLLAGVFLLLDLIFWKRLCTTGKNRFLALSI